MCSIRVFVCKDRDQHCVAIGELVCDNRRFIMIHPHILVFPHPNKLKIEIFEFSHMEIIFTNKKTLSGMGFYFMQVHFALGSSSINKANSEKCIVYSVKTSYTVTQLLISWVHIIQVRHFHLELFKKLSTFFLPKPDH